MVYEEEVVVKSPARRFIEKIGKRNLVIVGVVLLIGMAVWINWMVFADSDDGYSGYDQSSGMGTQYGDNTDTAGKGDSSSASNESENYFASTQVSRQRARDEALEVLQSVVDNSASDEATRTQALADINKIAQSMESESNIETLIMAKGFEQCVAVISGDAISVVVDGESLTPGDIAIINEIVYEQANILPANIKIIQK